MRKCLLFAALFTSCNDKYKESVSFITNQNNCWYLLRYPDEQLKNKAGFHILGCTKFYPDNTYQSFAIVSNQLEIQTPLEKELSNTGRWSYSPNDSVFTLDERRYLVHEIAEDTIYIVNEESKTEKLINYQFK